MSTPDQTPAAASAPGPAKKSNTLVIVLCVFLGIFLLVLASCVGTCIYVGKKAKDYSKSSAKNPQIAALALAASIAPGVEVVSKDLDAGTLVLKNTKTGEVINLDAKNFSQEKVSAMIEQMAQGKGVNVKMQSGGTSSATSGTDLSKSGTSASESSSSETSVSAAQADGQAATLKEFGADFPIYTSGGVKTTEASQNAIGKISTSQHSFVTSDSPSKVADFYGKKLIAGGYKVVASEDGSDENGPKISRVFQKDGMGSTFTVTAQIEDGKTRCEVNQVVLKK